MELSSLFDGLLDDRISLAFELIGAKQSIELPEAEAQAVAGAVEKRRREFAIGRELARRALARFSYENITIPAGSDRAPVWPTGIVGSISHSDQVCAVAVAQLSGGIASVGLDIEEAKPLSPDLWETVMSPAERARLPMVPDLEQGLLEMVVFSAKEASYKCQYQLSREFFDFSDFTVSLDVGAGTFKAQFNRNADPFKVGDLLEGRWRIANGHVATAVHLER
ncbi:MAG: 4'-phosphopantetheinyl transferase superfamily protein [Pseudomonadota bacterium]